MIVTISREYGAAGLAVADGVAHALGYALLTDDLPKTVAARLGTSPDAVSAIASSDRSLPERLLAGLELGAADMTGVAPVVPDDFDESVRREIERTIHERAAAGNIVVLGRNAGAVLGRRPDLLRVYLTADREWRASRLVDSFGQTRDSAFADMDRIDAARRKITKDRYKIAMGDARAYDLLIDVSRFGIAGAIALVVDAVRLASEAAR
ncbi:MAG: cytidylate kinase-like family protein [Candidatus Eremiobacteraeota bacterium]|nr:cytidylate kinase-like family protein [Candidatus Eremiobacteraeota bacterium]